jgi:hypothetical protein
LSQSKFKINLRPSSNCIKRETAISKRDTKDNFSLKKKRGKVGEMAKRSQHIELLNLTILNIKASTN